jgi:hypothetical protein
MEIPENTALKWRQMAAFYQMLRGNMQYAQLRHAASLWQGIWIA